MNGNKSYVIVTLKTWSFTQAGVIDCSTIYKYSYKCIQIVFSSISYKYK